MKHVIIGGGPSGVIYAVKTKLIHPEDECVIYESSSKILERILVSGNGRANFFNSNLLKGKLGSDVYDHGDSANLVINPSISLEVLKLLTSNLDYYSDSSGRIYPFSNASTSVYNALIKMIKDNDIKVIVNKKAMSISTLDKIVNFSDKTKVAYDKLFLATGGYSYNRELNSNMSLLDSLNLKVSKTTPALCPLVVNESIPKNIVGVRFFASISLWSNDKCVYSEDNSEVLIKKDGISGVGVFNCSLFMNEGKKYQVHLDLTKHHDNGVNDPLNLKAYINEKLISYMEQHGKDGKLIFNIKSKYGYKESQVTRGGISCLEINFDDMSLISHPDIKVGGEIVDVTAICGGYNLAWAFITGYKAANS